ncbi:sugar transferase [Bacillus sp. AFS029533]|uniref:sugar transferase n=1 Tax=Bacillus sp. AFS029533 TaxID=2033494 RepID=UPI002570CE70|nr:sugar transferase [Bacillus sp. AFS029533]
MQTTERSTNKKYLVIKRLMDILGALSGIFLLLPVFLVIAIIIKLEDWNGPAIFKQKRVGQNGKVFHIYKFRSMVTDAENKLKSNENLYKKYLLNNYKLEPHEDPRITKIGGFLRKTSLDEIPQFINILKGEMSLVGPRPVVQEELLEYGKKASEFLSVKPGATGYWQISGRSNVGYPERVDLELYYVLNKSLYLDIKILFLTVLHVLMRKGAY